MTIPDTELDAYARIVAALLPNLGRFVREMDRRYRGCTFVGISGDPGVRWILALRRACEREARMRRERRNDG